MRKTLFILAAISMTTAANAKILRVSNVSGSSAPYTTIKAAHDAAAVGDTIMVDGSRVGYGEYFETISKRIVLMGPGYRLVEDGIVANGASSAHINSSELTITAEGVTIVGMELDAVEIKTSKVVIKRCKVNDYIKLDEGADNCVIHQNFILGYISGTTMGAQTNYAQITNNIISSVDASMPGTISRLVNSYIANNTMPRKSPSATGYCYSYLGNCTLENNIAPKEDVYEGASNTFSNNYSFAPSANDAEYNNQHSPYTDQTDDKSICEIEQNFANGKYGACSGDSPYVVAGIPSGPVIQDLMIPASVEMGSNLNVTVKIGMVK